jgi:hypothetical protein
MEATSMVSVVLAAMVLWSAFGAIGAILVAVISGGLVLAARGLVDASNEAAKIKPKNLDDLLAVIKKLGTLNAGSLIGDLLNVVKTAALSTVAVEIRNTSITLNQVQNVKQAVFDDIKKIFENLGKLNTGNLFHDWGEAIGTGALAATAKNIVTISADLNHVSPVDSKKMDEIKKMLETAGKLDAGNLFKDWGTAQATGSLASAAKNILQISEDLAKVQIVDPSKMDKIAQMITTAGKKLDVGGFWHNWGEAAASKQFKDSMDNLVMISTDIGKIKIVTDAQIANLDKIQAYINKAGSLKFNVMQITAQDLAAMTNQGVTLASKFVDGVRQLFDMAYNAGHDLQSRLWRGIQDHMNDMFLQGQSLVRQVINGMNSLAGDSTQAGHNIQSKFWQSIQSHMNDEYQQGVYLVKQVINGINNADPDATNAGHKIQSAFWQAIQSHFGDEYQQGIYLAKQVLNGIDSQMGGFGTAGSQAAQGFANGVNANAGAAARAGSSLANAALANAKATLQSHSPSRAMHEIGMFAGQGFFNGIMSMVDQVGTAGQAIADALMNPLSKQSLSKTLNGTINGLSPLLSPAIANTPQMQPSAGQGSSNTYHIQNLHLPNVQNPEDFGRELQLMTLGRA